MAVLSAIGAVHAFLLWSGDILLYCAVLGLALVPLTWAPAWRTVRWAVGVAIVPVVIDVGLFSLTTLAAFDEEAQRALAEDTAARNAMAESPVETALATYRGTDVGAMIAVRAAEWGWRSLAYTRTQPMRKAGAEGG